MAGPQTLFAPAAGSGTETPAAEPAPALSRPWAGQPVSPDPPAAFLLAQAHPPPDVRDEHLLHAQACLQSHDQLKTRAPHRAQAALQAEPRGARQSKSPRFLQAKLPSFPHFCARILRMSSLCQVCADTNLSIAKFIFQFSTCGRLCAAHSAPYPTRSFG